MHWRVTDLFGEGAPVTKEDVADESHPNGGYYKDGMDGGAEYSDDVDIDRLIYPKARLSSPEHIAHHRSKYQRECERQDIKREFHMRSRDFNITEGSVTGEDPGPPNLFGKEKEK